ncbi:MAG: c-type cytochrome [Agarilytica sp.]
MQAFTTVAMKLLALAFLSFALSACNITATSTEGGSVSFSPVSTQSCTATDGVCFTYGDTETVTLSPVAEPGFEFVGWSGECSGMGFCEVLADDDKSVHAQFVRIEDLVITNTSADLETVLENNRFAGACDRYFADPAGASEYLTLMCGKWMFFYDGFGASGLPQGLAEYMTQYLPNTVGTGFSKFGMIPDPYSETGLPLGFPVGRELAPGIPTLAYGCASCHFGKTRDGRFSVGHPNHEYDYGNQILASAYFPTFATESEISEEDYAPETVALMQPLLEEYASSNSSIQLLSALLPLTTIPAEEMQDIDIPVEYQSYYASWKSGVQDFMITPVGIDDEVHTATKIQHLWEIPTPEEMAASGGPHSAMLSSFGGALSLEQFFQGFLLISAVDGESFGIERGIPLVKYVYSLEAPSNPNPPAVESVAKGEALFASKGCAGCHNGPGYSGTRIFTFDEIGTDDALRFWGDKDQDGEQDFPSVDGTNGITHGVKAPRMNGIWSLTRLLHNGSVESLDDLFCMDRARPTIEEYVFSDKGHMMTCDGLSDEEKQDLISYLNTL